jgi:hypothetical protein
MDVTRLLGFRGQEELLRVMCEHDNLRHEV